ncbi:MAG: endonuclease III [Acidilobaceae archaeon]
MTDRRITDSISCSEVYEVLSKSLEVNPEDYTVLVALAVGGGSPFSVLVGAVLSQNTSDKNSIRALKSLAERVGLSPEKILEAGLSEVEEAIKTAGLWKSKARAIVELARLVLSRGGEEYLLREDPLVLREELLRVRGVGPKTVDVFLSVARRAPVFPVDTHAARVALRWGLASSRRYSEVSRALLECFGAERSEEAHRLVIALGRAYCRARRPRCKECPLRAHCPSSEA